MLLGHETLILRWGAALSLTNIYPPLIYANTTMYYVIISVSKIWSAGPGQSHHAWPQINGLEYWSNGILEYLAFRP
jgi:hypothetical protein